MLPPVISETHPQSHVRLGKKHRVSHASRTCNPQHGKHLIYKTVDAYTLKHFALCILLPSLSAPASPLMTVTGLVGLVQNWWRGGKKASLLFSSCMSDRKTWTDSRLTESISALKRSLECLYLLAVAKILRINNMMNTSPYMARLYSHKYWVLGDWVCPLAVEEMAHEGAVVGDTCPRGCCWSTGRSSPDSCR